MATVLIVSRTQMANGVCIGGINEDTNELIRVHNERGGNLSINAPYQIGDRWEMIVERAWNSRPEPHVEDKQTTPINKINNVGMSGIITYVMNHNLDKYLTCGALSLAFEGKLHLDGSNNFINRDGIPAFSTQFWIADRDLIHSVRFNNHYYLYNDIRLKFVGFQELVDRIPAGTIIRLSLANWWNRNGEHEDRCYLQLSGWYL